MSIDNILAGLPDYAKDLSRNLSTLVRGSILGEQQLWGTLLASAAASRNAVIIAEMSEEAQRHLSESAVDAAFTAASLMAMNNVAFRAKSWLGAAYAQVRVGLRMNFIANPGVARADFDLRLLAVSTINGCEDCTVAHERDLQTQGLTKEQIFEAIKIAATVQGIAQVAEIEANR